jgi:hypothetical protein
MPESREQRIAYLEFALFYRKFGKITSWFGEKVGMRRMAKLATALAYHPKTANDKPLHKTYFNRKITLNHSEI